MGDLTIDFTDREDIQAKLPKAQRHLDELETALVEQAKEVEEWRIFVEMLIGRAKRLGVDIPRASSAAVQSQPEAVTPPDAEAQPVDLVVEVVNRQVRKIKAKTVADILRSEGHNITNVTVSNSLFYAAKRVKPARIKAAAGRGFYAPLAYVEPTTSALADGHAGPDELQAAFASSGQQTVDGGEA